MLWKSWGKNGRILYRLIVAVPHKTGKVSHDKWGCKNINGAECMKSANPLLFLSRYLNVE
jgi:hypothetical protein